MFWIYCNCIGTVMYSALTVALHPLTVSKIRKQVQAPMSASAANNSSFFNNIGQYYRGLGVVLTLAIPSRIIYISTLEYSRELVDMNVRQFIANPPTILRPYNNDLVGLLPLVTPISGGIAGGLAATASQMIVVPMDVISQKQMVMPNDAYKRDGSSIKIARSIIKRDGYRGLYKGFGLSLFTSLPAGTIWWATYAGCRDKLMIENDRIRSIPVMAQQGIIQVASAVSAAVAASITTQPLDTIKTRIQVGKKTMSMKPNTSLASMAREFVSTPGLYKGLTPRIVHMSIWGSILSAAFEVLKLVSRKDFEF